MVKKGFFFWIEMIFLIIVITIAVLSMPKSEDNFLKTKDTVDLEKIGFSALRNLDQARILENLTNTTNFTASNFTALSTYMRKSLPSTIDTKLEYFNGTTCFSEAGLMVSSCGNFSIATDTTVVHYTFARTPNPVTIRLYLRRFFS